MEEEEEEEEEDEDEEEGGDEYFFSQLSPPLPSLMRKTQSFGVPSRPMGVKMGVAVMVVDVVRTTKQSREMMMAVYSI